MYLSFIKDQIYQILSALLCIFAEMLQTIFLKRNLKSRAIKVTIFISLVILVKFYVDCFIVKSKRCFIVKDLIAQSH